MNEKDFKSLMLAIRGEREPDWNERLQDCKKIVQELWGGEFRDEIDEDKRIIVRIVLDGEIDSLAAMKEMPFGGFVIFINRKIWEGEEKGRLREILRHEMLHCSTGWGHEDPRFDIEAEKRKVFPWDNIRDY